MTYSQGVRFIKGYNLSFILIINVLFYEKMGCSERNVRFLIKKGKGERFI